MIPCQGIELEAINMKIDETDEDYERIFLAYQRKTLRHLEHIQGLLQHGNIKDADDGLGQLIEDIRASISDFKEIYGE